MIELDHNEAAEILDIGQAVFRKRLSRARAEINKVMLSRCSIIKKENPCHCAQRGQRAVAMERINPDKLLFASSVQQAKAFPKVVALIEEIDEVKRAGVLYNSHYYQSPSQDFINWINQIGENYC